MASHPSQPLNASPAGFWRAAALAWAGFWFLMLMVGIQDEARQGGNDRLRPYVDYGTAALLATLVALWQIRHVRPPDSQGSPLRWFARQAASALPLLLVYVCAIYGLRHAIYALNGQHYRHAPWVDVFLYEGAKFLIFYGLFCGVHFGLRSYQAWHAERLRTAQQASLAQQAQLVQLTQQLHPHFLFNALNTVSSLIHSDPDMADRLLTRFATVLRAAMDAGRRPTRALADELVLLEAYAQIMTQRFADRVSVDWQIDDAARACELPTFGLQPLLENCFRHVVEQRVTLTRIVVRAQRQGAHLCIEVENDGDPLSPPLHFGLGLGNLAQRLRALYGDRARLQLLPRAGGGLVARVELPCGC